MDKNQNQLNAEADVVKTTNTSIATQILNNINKNENVETETEVVSNPIKEETIAHVPQEVSQPKSELQLFGDNWRIACQLSKSTILPDNYRGKPENVIIALGMAQKMDLDPFTVMQNLNVIKGKTSWSGSFCKTLIEKTKRFKDLELNYIGEKGTDSYGCYLSATRISDGKIIKGPEVTMKMAKEEGWTSNKKWITLTDLMLAYRCQSFFARLHCPEAMNGIYTSEEIEDIQPTIKKTVEDVL